VQLGLAWSSFPGMDAVHPGVTVPVGSSGRPVRAGLTDAARHCDAGMGTI